MCDISIDDPCSAWTETTRTARKPYRCDCCSGAISVGDRYTRIFMVSDGRPATERECVGCAAMMVQFKAHHSSWWSPSGMRDLLAECLAEETIWNDDDERVPASDLGRMWAAELAAMDARADARRMGVAA